MSTLRKQLVRLAHGKPELRTALVPLLKTAIEFPTEDARKKYLDDHPNADPKNHSVTDSRMPAKGESPASTDIKGRLQSLFNSIKPKKSIADSLKGASEAVHKVIVSKDSRDEFTSQVAQAVKKSPKTLSSKILESAKSELHELGHAVKASKKLFKKPPGPFSKADKAAFYSAGAYAASTALALIPPGGPMIAAAALGKSFALHVGIKAASTMLDKGFLHFEWAETVLHAVAKLASTKSAAEKAEAEEAAFMEGLTRIVGETLAKGISDDEIEKIMKGVEMPSDEGVSR